MAPVSAATIDIDSDAFSRRLANLLRGTRLERGASLRAVVRASGGQFTKDQLKHLEAGSLMLDEMIVESAGRAYGADLSSMLPTRLPVAIGNGVISAGGVNAAFVPKNSTSLLTAYLRLIRSMRRQKKEPLIALRREDVVVLARYLDEPAETIVDRLTALMGSTLTQRTAMASMFATGAVVIGLAGATAARAPDPGESGNGVGSTSASTTVMLDDDAVIESDIVPALEDVSPADTVEQATTTSVGVGRP